MRFGQQVNGCLFKEIPSQQKLFSLSDFPHKLESQRFFTHRVLGKGSQIKKKKSKKKKQNRKIPGDFLIILNGSKVN